MKITKLGHSCLLVEMPDRTALFDPGVWSQVNVDSLQYLDDIIITHEHQDHMDVDLIKQLQQKFPDVRIKAASHATGLLNEAGLKTMQDADEGVAVFDAPHEELEPLGTPPDNMGVHYLGKLTVPGDSLQFDTTMPILALPVTAPWCAVRQPVKLALQLKPKYIVPVHDWHWREEAREQMYDMFEGFYKEYGVSFIKPVNGEAFTIDA